MMILYIYLYPYIVTDLCGIGEVVDVLKAMFIHLHKSLHYSLYAIGEVGKTL